MVREVDRAVERALFKTIALEKLFSLFIAEPRQISLHLCADYNKRRALLLSIRLQRFNMGVALAGDAVVRNVGAENDGLIG